jgi:DNA topoisomerase-1
VQSVALRLICEREEEIEKFIATEYWSINSSFQTEKGEEIRAKLFEVDGKQIKFLQNLK